MRQQKEAYFARDVAVHLVLPRRSTEGDQEQDIPGKSDLEEHLEVEDTEHARVQLRTHEEVVDRVSGHAVLRATSDGREVRDERNQETRQDGHAHQGSKFVDERVQLEQPGGMQGERNEDGGVPGPNGGAVIRQLLAPLVRKRTSLKGDSREEHVAESLKDEEDPVDRPCLEGRECALVHEVTEVGEEIGQALTLRRQGQLAIIVCRSNPHVVHEKWEPNHHGQHAP